MPHHKIELAYFNRSGLCVGYYDYVTERETMESVIFEANCRRDDGALPGLLELGIEDHYILITCNEAWAYPHLVLPPFLKEAVRAHWCSIRANASNSAP